MAGNRYYWLKLKRDFFKRHDIRIIEGMPNGHEMVLFYLKLLCESVDHDGELRFSDKIPYDAEMLASVTNTDIEVVKKALEVLEKLDMLSYKKDKTIVMLDIGSMLGSETEWAAKKRRQRDGTGTEEGLEEDSGRTVGGLEEDFEGTFSDKSIENRERERVRVRVREKEEKEEKRVVPTRRSSQVQRFVKPSVEEVRSYCDERHNGIDAQQFWDFYEAKGWKVGNQCMKDWKACVRTWEARTKKEQKQQNTNRFMENEYTKEHLEKKEQESMDLLDELLRD